MCNNGKVCRFENANCVRPSRIPSYQAARWSIVLYTYIVILYYEEAPRCTNLSDRNRSLPTGNKWNAIELFRCTFSTQLELRRISQEILAVQTIETLPLV